ncbi:hypothetical protein, partial [Streptococcus suis]
EQGRRLIFYYFIVHLTGSSSRLKPFFYYGFEPVFLEEKNKKTTSYAGGCQGFEFPFLFHVII